jgi:lysozyme
VSAQLKRLLEDDEGRVPHAYQDSLGYWTIGVGHLIDKRKGGGLPDHIIDALLDWDIEQKSSELHDALPWTAALDDVRRDTVVCMAFQLGVPGLLKFRRALGALRDSKWEEAAAEFLDSDVAKLQTPERWKRHAKRIITGEWQ